MLSHDINSQTFRLHYTHNHGRRKGRHRRGPWALPAFGNLTFSYQKFSKKNVFLVSIRKKENSRFCPPTKIIGFTWKYCPMPMYTIRLINRGQWWTILIWSGSTKGWSRAGSANLLICTSGESRIIFLPERSSICQYPPKISAINIKKSIKSTSTFGPPCIVHFKNTKNVRCILKTTVSKSTKKR